MKTTLKSLSAVLLLVVLSGCISYNAKVDNALSALRSGNDPVALVWAESYKHTVYSKDLGFLEAGRVRMLGGDFLGSSTNFSAAIDTVMEMTDTGPRVKVGDMGANILAGTLTDDRTRPYRLPPYEFIQALEYQMLNHIFLGDLEAAGVEARRAVAAQDQVAEKYGADISGVHEAVPEENTANLQAVEGQMETMNAVADLARCSYENPLTWWLCGLVFEHQSDNANARLAYQKAYELMPGNPFIQRDWLLALRSEDQVAYQAAVRQANIGPAPLTRPTTELLVIFEEGFVPQRLSKKIPLPIMTSVVSIDFPLYEAPAYTPVSAVVSVGAQELGYSALALNVQALAYRDLKEQLPGIVTRNITRAATRVGAAVAAKQIKGDSGGMAQAVVFLSTAVASAVNRADTRAWYTLPMVAHLWRGAIEPGEHTVELRNPLNGLVTRIPITVAPGEKRLVWIADTGYNARVSSASLNGKGAATTFDVFNSVLHPPLVTR